MDAEWTTGPKNARGTAFERTGTGRSRSRDKNVGYIAFILNIRLWTAVIRYSFLCQSLSNENPIWTNKLDFAILSIFKTDGRALFEGNNVYKSKYFHVNNISFSLYFCNILFRIYSSSVWKYSNKCKSEWFSKVFDNCTIEMKCICPIINVVDMLYTQPLKIVNWSLF